MKPKQSFEDIQARIQDHYQSGEYASALALASEHAPRFPDQAPLFTYWRICMTARLEQADKSLRILDEALGKGIWFGEVLLRKSPSLQALQGLAAFEHLVMRNQQLQAQDEALHYPVLTLRSQGACVPGGPACPLLLALHANASTARASLDFWQAPAARGWLVGVPQSTQAMWKDAFVWNDREAALRQLEKHFAVLAKQYVVDPGRVVLAGHSMGGETAIWLALNGALPAAGFIAIGPGGPLMDEPEAWQPFIDQAQARIAETGLPLRGTIIYGTDDESIPQAGIQALASHLNRAGITCDLDAVPGGKHDFQQEYAEALKRGLDAFEDFWASE